MPGLNILRKKVLSITGPGITLTNIEIKDIIKVINSQENRTSLLRATTEKVKNQEGGYLGKGVLMSLWLPAAVSATDTTIEREILWSEVITLIILNKGMENIMKQLDLL